MKIRTAVGITAGVMALSGIQQVAASEAEILDRMQKMEQELSELRQQLKEEEAKPGVTMKPGTTFEYGGFIKVDGMWSDYSDGPRPGNIGDDILVPSTIPIGGESEGAQFDAHAKTSRLFFKTTTQTDVGVIRSHIEMDMLGGGGDERISNSVHSRLRHAFVSWEYEPGSSIMAGQSWSTFFNVGALPEAVEFIGPTSGTIFNRQVQLRWTKKMGNGSLMLAAENPSSSFTEAGSGIAGSNFDDNAIPDLVARYNGKSGKLSWSAAVLGREIAYDTGAMDDSKYGVGLSLSGKLAIGERDDLKFMFNYGNLGRYIALNAFRDGGIAVDGGIELTEIMGGFVAYRHFWSSKLRSTFTLATATADLANGLAATNTETVTNINANLLYSPTPKLTFGGELIRASRELENGADGDLTRLQFMAKYAF